MRLEINRSLCGQSNEAVSPPFFWVEVECQELVLISKPWSMRLRKSITLAGSVSINFLCGCQTLLLLFVQQAQSVEDEIGITECFDTRLKLF